MRKILILGMLIAAMGASRAQESEPVTAQQQVVLETDYGAIVLELFPQAAPRHVARFIQRVKEGFYVGTTFFRVVPYGIIQGGDPISRDPDRRAEYGTGGLYELTFEPNDVLHTPGTLSAVRVPGDRNSAGSQFFICLSPQTALDGEYTAFGRVAEGLEVAARISALPADANQRVEERVEITRAYLRDRPPPLGLPFAETGADELARHHAVIHTDLGEIELAFFPQEAIQHVRQFLSFAQLGIYDGTPIHRIVPSFVIQGGSIAKREEPLAQKFAPLLHYLEPEIHPARLHLRGALSMARGSEPNSAMDSFFIVLEDQPGLDGDYTVFGQVIRGMDVVDMISLQPIAGETPVKPLKITVSVIRVEQ